MHDSIDLSTGIAYNIFWPKFLMYIGSDCILHLYDGIATRVSHYLSLSLAPTWPLFCCLLIPKRLIEIHP